MAAQPSTARKVWLPMAGYLVVILSLFALLFLLLLVTVSFQEDRWLRLLGICISFLTLAAGVSAAQQLFALRPHKWLNVAFAVGWMTTLVVLLYLMVLRAS